MSYEEFRELVLSRPGAREYIAAQSRTHLIAHYLRVARKRAGVSQRELARRMGISQPRIAAIERAEDVTLSTVLRYAEGIGARLRLDLDVGGDHISLLGDHDSLLSLLSEPNAAPGEPAPPVVSPRSQSETAAKPPAPRSKRRYSSATQPSPPPIAATARR